MKACIPQIPVSPLHFVSHLPEVGMLTETAARIMEQIETLNAQLASLTDSVHSLYSPEEISAAKASVKTYGFISKPPKVEKPTQYGLSRGANERLLQIATGSFLRSPLRGADRERLAKRKLESLMIQTLPIPRDLK